MDVTILAGGMSHERDVSVRSGRRVREALRARGVKARLRDVDANVVETLRDIDDGVVWPLLHGAAGEDGSLQALLELTGVPFVGTSSSIARVAWSKPVAKEVLRRAGVTTPHGVALPQTLFRDVGAEHVLDAVEESFSFPLVVKPARGGSALGVTLVTERSELSRAMVHCFAYCEAALVEKALVGTEVAVSVVGTGDQARSLPAVEIVSNGPYDYDARYNAGRVEYFVPARLGAEEIEQVERAALMTHQELGLRDYSRIDIILSDGAANVIDVNIAPGMTETSLFPQAVGASGDNLGAICERIATEAMRRGA
ncbi:D-alanine--D-alanine ligase family protein [Demequina aurantiaca]|uniref:D-alanine--D-alanine ligase family protein n=1 Tax=Demequina aurantiaca TaxID=676200 RepID=UPI000783CCBA|nr:ATP-grasp domain-containing protein [Demequina aurantiaca]